MHTLAFGKQHLASKWAAAEYSIIFSAIYTFHLALCPIEFHLITASYFVFQFMVSCVIPLYIISLTRHN